MRKQFLFIFCVFLVPFFSFGEEKKVFIGAIVGNYDKLTESFLKSIEKLDYDKKQLTLQLHVLNSSPQVIHKVNLWVEKNKGLYRNLFCVYDFLQQKMDPTLLFLHPQRKFALLGNLKNGFLRKTKELDCDYCMIIEPNVFLQPFSLKELIGKNKAIITPVLRPVPEVNDPHCNFLATVNEEGFLNASYDFFVRKDKRDSFYANSSDIIDRITCGTVCVESAFGAFLIEKSVLDQLTFQDGVLSEDFFAFARSRKKNNLEHFISNEREFGSILHFQKPLSFKEEKSVFVPALSVEVTQKDLEGLFAPFWKDDVKLKEYFSTFSSVFHSVYAVENKDCFYVDEKTDLIKTWWIKRGRAWEPHVTEVLAQYVRPGSVVIDIGGHMGSHTLSLSRLVGDSGTVHVFEPQLKLFSELVVNMSLNGCKNICFHRMALGNAKSEGGLLFAGKGNEGTCYVSLSAKETAAETIFIEPLDAFKLTDVSLIKIDVEGFERQVLEGAKETLFTNKPVLVLEMSGSADEVSKTKQFLEDLGYQFFFLGVEDYLCIPSRE